MKKRDFVNLGVVFIFVLYIIFYKTVLITSLLRYENIITSLFLVIMAFSTYLFYGYKKIKENPKRKGVFNLVIYEIILVLVLYYGSGLIFGFNNNIYSLEIPKILFNVTCPLLIIVSGELIRHMVIQANKDRKWIVFAITVLLATLELLSIFNYFSLTSGSGIFKLFACGLLTLLVKHSLLSYLTYYTGVKTSLLYRLVFTLYIYLVPIVPSYDDYLMCLVELMIPFIVFMSTSSIIHKREYVEGDFKQRKFTIVDGALLACFILMISLVGGVFNVKMVAIASDSMNPVIYKGDSVIIEKNDGNKVYQKDDIISFDYNGRNTIHRVVEVEEKEGTYYYHTKGDNNNAEDTVLVPVNNIYGKVIFKVRFVGYPAVFVSELRK